MLEVRGFVQILKSKHETLKCIYAVDLKEFSNDAACFSVTYFYLTVIKTSNCNVWSWKSFNLMIYWTTIQKFIQQECIKLIIKGLSRENVTRSSQNILQCLH